MRPVISNTGPLIALADIGQLELLRQLYETIFIPPAVRAEVLNEPARAAVQAALTEGWLSEQRPSDTHVISLLNESLDPGESEAIALAQQIEPRWIILDDLAARHVAEAIGLPVIGTLGVLVQAKDTGYVTKVKPLLDKLRDHNLYLSEALYTHILKSANEAE
jgi:predicted nucleic acid-binding protein